MRKTVTVVALGAALAGAIAVAPPAMARSSAGMQPAYTCSIDSASDVAADWLRVHTQPSATSPAVGQLPYGARFHYCASSATRSGGYTWVYGYGYNGSTKLTGWVVYGYLANP
jgi:hypothetical protein